MGRPKATSDQGKAILARIRRIKPFLEGSFVVTRKRCGNPKCRCAREGPIHETAQVTWKEGGTTRSLYVPAACRAEVKRWVEEAKLLRRLAKHMSQEQRVFLITRKKNNKP